MKTVRAIVPDIDKSSLDLLVSLYFGTEDRAWYYQKSGCKVEPSVLRDLQQSGLIDLVDSSQRGYMVSCKFGATAAGEEVIKQVFLAEPDRVLVASRSYLTWVPVSVTDVLRYATNALRSDISRLPELLVSEVPIISETASLILSWVQEGQVMESVDITSSNLVG